VAILASAYAIRIQWPAFGVPDRLWSQLVKSCERTPQEYSVTTLTGCGQRVRRLSLALGTLRAIATPAGGLRTLGAIHVDALEC
jgi:hypothetical protein